MSRREEVLEAVKALISTALPHATVLRNREKPARPSPGGDVIIEDGEPGEPEIDLSPLTYNYSHRIPIFVGSYDSAPNEALDSLLAAVGAAVEADRTLGGLCDFVETEAPDSSDLEVTGAESGRAAAAALIAHYSTRSPL